MDFSKDGSGSEHLFILRRKVKEHLSALDTTNWSVGELPLYHYILLYSGLERSAL